MWLLHSFGSAPLDLALLDQAVLDQALLGQANLPEWSASCCGDKSECVVFIFYFAQILPGGIGFCVYHCTGVIFCVLNDLFIVCFCNCRCSYLSAGWL